ncbi:conserved exported hypothetical protein [Sphingomonas sp. EC-HK361]|jgi:hypothetical protein|uniref:GCG_CRPN prefix-to-repeats domain-containing protein n=1 Tax=Sphingomonas sp. EC-HK361 TaxID=2038397 RepID=UPI0012592E60|nr:hypothetical protein [Sphingomonas sp. EC-HK361]VVT16767.1 conserved exported hypothetical protein [Sphingomonas sp. EC-HK361]
MKKLLLLAVAMGTTVGSASVADARQGCGVGFHRGPRGHCVVNRAGGFYRGYGWWDGRRYWQHRYRWHNGWRYR